MTRADRTGAWGMLFAALLVAASCRTAPVAPPEAAPSPSRAAPAAEPAAPAEELESEGFGEGIVAEQPLEEPVPEAEDLAGNVAANLRTVYFGFDSSEIDDAAREVLERNSRWLIEHPGVRIVVEGHCDERGTLEYNLELGARRARAVRDYLVRLGVAPDRIRTISYGEERPADPGQGETAWARNRRAEFKGD